MDEKLYYEVNVTLSHEIKAAYDYAVANNIPNYRCLAKNGAIFGWDNEGVGKYIRAQDGQEWFKNPEYKETVVELETEEVAQTKSEVLSGEEQVITDSEQIMPVEPDYKALYEEEKEKHKNLYDEYISVFSELNQIKTAILTLTKEFKEAQEKLGE